MKKLVCLLLIFSMIFFCISFKAFAEENEINSENDISTDNSTSLSCGGVCFDGYEPNFPDYSQPRNNNLPAKYDPRTDDGYTMPVKSQGSAGTCGIFATNACLEITGYKQTGLKYQISEEAPRYILSKRLALLNGIADSGNNKYVGYYNNDINGAWNFRKITSYASNFNNPIIDGNNVEWRAPVLSTDVPYDDDSNSWPENIGTSNASFYVTGTECVEKERFNEKIKEYGAVYTTALFNDESFNGVTGANYTTSQAPNHAIAVVGWDNNYSINNFNSDNLPPEDGAWLVKSSYGDAYGDGGYSWVSYHDKSFDYLKQGNVITSVAPLSKNEYILSHDFTSFNNRHDFFDGKTSNVYNSNVVYTCNVYDVSDYCDTYDVIDKVMFYANGVGGTYDIYIEPVATDGAIPSVSLLGASLASGDVTKDGLMTVSLDTDFTIIPDVEKYAIIIKHSDTDQVVPIREDNISANPKVNQGESYYSTGGAWSDIYSSLNIEDAGNYCIRPILRRATPITQNSTVSPAIVTDGNDACSVTLNLKGNQLFSIKQGDKILYQDKDFIRDGNEITFTDSYLNTLTSENSYVTITFTFTDGADKTVRIYPKEVYEVVLEGKAAIGQTLIANVTYSDGTVPQEGEVSYQWQASTDGFVWQNIPRATTSSHTIGVNERGYYIKCKVTVNSSLGYIKPGYKDSPQTELRVVRFGDADGDGVVTENDVLRVRQSFADLVTLTEEQIFAADVDGNSLVNLDDAYLIELYVLREITSFPVQG